MRAEFPHSAPQMLQRDADTGSNHTDAWSFVSGKRRPSTSHDPPATAPRRWLVSAASIRSLPPNRLGHVLMLWYRTDVLAALARGNDTRGGGGASGNGTPAAAGTNAAAANGTAGGPQRGAGVDEDAAAAAEAAVAARAVPATWQALLQLVAALNGTDWDGDGRVKYGICLNRDPGGPARVQPTTGCSGSAGLHELWPFTKVHRMCITWTCVVP